MGRTPIGHLPQLQEELCLLPLDTWGAIAGDWAVIASMATRLRMVEPLIAEEGGERRAAGSPRQAAWADGVPCRHRGGGGGRGERAGAVHRVPLHCQDLLRQGAPRGAGEPGWDRTAPLPLHSILEAWLSPITRFFLALTQAMM